MTTGLYTSPNNTETQANDRSPGDLAHSTRARASRQPSGTPGSIGSPPAITEPPWLSDFQLILTDLPYADEHDDDEPSKKPGKKPGEKRSEITVQPETKPASKAATRAAARAAAKRRTGKPGRKPGPGSLLAALTMVLGSGAVRQRRQVITIVSATVLAALVYLALQGTVLRPAEAPAADGINADTTADPGPSQP